MAINKKNDRKIWYELDLSAIVYPTLQRRDFSSVYRLSVVLKETIDPEILQQAVDISLRRFPTYKVAIRKGLFWRYLETNNRPFCSAGYQKSMYAYALQGKQPLSYPHLLP